MLALSPNFEFLREHDELLVVYAARAERYVFDDPNSSLLKTRQLAEHLAKHVAAKNAHDPTDVGFRDLMALLRERRWLPRPIFEHFELIRLWGNRAAHENESTRTNALMSLTAAREIAIWFHRTLTGDVKFNPGAFRPPPVPVNPESELRVEIEELQDTLATERNRAEGRVREVEAVLADLKKESEDARCRLVEVELLLSQREKESESQSTLMTVYHEAALNPSITVAPSLKSFIDRSRAAADRVHLWGEEGEHLPITQLRIMAARRSSCCGAPLLLVQSKSGGFVMWNCGGCKSARSVRQPDFDELDLWVSCPNCQTRCEKTMLKKNYGFQCPKCQWRFLLSTLAPHYKDL